MAKQILFEEEARQAMKKGVDTLANAVKVVFLLREKLNWKISSRILEQSS